MPLGSDRPSRFASAGEGQEALRRTPLMPRKGAQRSEKQKNHVKFMSMVRHRSRDERYLPPQNSLPRRRTYRD